jgi:prefoldin subunit 5
MLSYGYIVEMTREEAISFCTAKLTLLKKRRDFLDTRSETIQSHIKQLLYGVAELRMTAELGLLEE